CR
ncbi:tryptophan/tyrosine permease family protein, partial [Vibrio parahaemolyticus V-223/04]